MKCEMCGRRQAVVFVQQLSGGTKSELRLCAQCAKERGIDRDGDIAQALSKLLAAAPLAPAARKELPAACPFCGSTLEEAKSAAMAGCAVCWELFGAELLRKAYADAPKRRHRGRLPVRLEARRAQEAELASVKEGLARAIADEDYESAARCRDRIRALEGGDSSRA